MTQINQWEEERLKASIIGNAYIIGDRLVAFIETNFWGRMLFCNSYGTVERPLLANNDSAPRPLCLLL